MFMKNNLSFQFIIGSLYSCVQLTLWIKTNINQRLKTKSECTSILKNKIILLNSTRRSNIVTKVRVSLHNTVKIKPSKARQKKITSTQLRLDLPPANPVGHLPVFK